MNAKKKTLLLLTTSAVAASLVATLAISFNSDTLRARGLGEVVDGSVTWTAATSEKSGSGAKISWKRQTARGTDMYLYSYEKGTASGQKLYYGGTDYTFDYFLTIKSSAGDAGTRFRFQYITSVTIVCNGSDNGAGYRLYTDESASGSVVATHSVGTGEDSHTFTSEVAGAKYFTLRPADSKWIAITSLTITYSCEPGGPSENNISKSEDVGYTISTSQTTATAGDKVSFSINVATGYTLNGVSVKTIPGSEDVTVTGPVAGQYSFIMPTSEVEISADMSGLHHLGFGYGYKTEYQVGESFEKPQVFAYNYGDTVGTDVTASATASGYNMAVAGQYTVTVSYTDSLSATVTKDYTITVSASSEHSISFAGFDYNIEEEVDVSEFLEDSSVLPTSCAAGDTVTFTLVFKESFQYDFYGPFFQHDPEGSGFYLISYDPWPNTTWTVEMPDRDVVIMLGYL